jgi:hypothetical protein
MSVKKFSSPKEEALEIAIQTRKDILEGKKDAISTLRSCLVIAEDLNKKEEEQWIKAELSGYNKSDIIPEYRKINCKIISNLETGEVFEVINVFLSVHSLNAILQSKNPSFEYVWDDKTRRLLQEYQTKELLNSITDKCLFFLNDIIAELQYGGIVEYLMEEIRKNTDEKLITIDERILNEAQSIYVNLTSTNPADWSKVAHSCRNMLKLLADTVFPQREEKYKMKDGRIFEVGNPNYINRLCAFLDQKISGGERKFLITEINYLENYIREVVEYDQMGEHKPSIEKFHANMMAIYTYLIISEIIKHI